MENLISTMSDEELISAMESHIEAGSEDFAEMLAYELLERGYKVFLG